MPVWLDFSFKKKPRIKVQLAVKIFFSKNFQSCIGYWDLHEKLYILFNIAYSYCYLEMYDSQGQGLSHLKARTQIRRHFRSDKHACVNDQANSQNFFRNAKNLIQ